jgi:radical SAM protein with 4Fe4S-binding SPASM domain
MYKDKKNFCILPWTHMHMWPAGTTYPCCMADPELPIGDTQTQSLQEIWNSDRMKQLRLDMLEDKRNPICRRCHELEDSGVWTLRKSSNLNFASHKNKVDDTEEDGSAGEVNLAYMDIRFSNLCNLKCRSCGPLFSSSWFDDHVEMYGSVDHNKFLKVRDDSENFMDELDPLLETVERVYWAGGEPLITEEHYRILDKWIEMGKRNVVMDYTTNFTQMRYKKKSIFEYWNAFDDVRVAASLDANHARGEYLRKNMDWAQVVQNRRDMIEQCPHVYFEITPTVSVYNVLNLPDFHKEWIEEGLLEPGNIRINILLDPTYMRLSILPPWMKRRVIKRYEEHLDYLKNIGANKFVNKQFRDILAMLEKDHTNELKTFLYKTKKVDKVRGEDWLDVFPELKDML